MPVAVRELNGERWYGATFSLLMLGQLVGTAALGNTIDSRGPVSGFVAGLGALIGGLVLGGSAGQISILLVSRFLVGIGAGAIFTVGFATVGLGYPDAIRPRVNAAVSSAWVLPGLVGPGLSGWLTDRYTWRLALFGVIPIAVIAGAIVMPALPRKVHAVREVVGQVVGEVVGSDTNNATPVVAPPDPFWRLSQRRRTAFGVMVSAGIGLVLSGLQTMTGRNGSTGIGWMLVLAGGGLMLGALRGGLLPRATFRASNGLGATVAATGLLIAGYSGAEAFLPLALQRLRGLTSAQAGLALSLAAVSWSIGSWVHGRRPATLRVGRNAPIAVVVVATGVMAAALLAWSAFPLWAMLVFWGAGAFGMGLVFNLLSERPFQLVETNRIGIVSSAVQIANALGAAISSGIGGALVARFGTEDASGKVVATATGTSLAFGFSAACLAVCALIIGRACRESAVDAILDRCSVACGEAREKGGVCSNEEQVLPLNGAYLNRQLRRGLFDASETDPS